MTETKPEPFMQGSFALYWLPDGSMVVAYHKKGEEKSEQLVVPAFVVEMASKMGGGANPLEMLKALSG